MNKLLMFCRTFNLSITTSWQYDSHSILLRVRDLSNGLEYTRMLPVVEFKDVLPNYEIMIFDMIVQDMGLSREKFKHLLTMWNYGGM